MGQKEKEAPMMENGKPPSEMKERMKDVTSGCIPSLLMFLSLLVIPLVITVWIGYSDYKQLVLYRLNQIKEGHIRSKVTENSPDQILIEIDLSHIMESVKENAEFPTNLLQSLSTNNIQDSAPVVVHQSPRRSSSATADNGLKLRPKNEYRRKTLFKRSIQESKEEKEEPWVLDFGLKVEEAEGAEAAASKDAKNAIPQEDINLAEEYFGENESSLDGEEVTNCNHPPNVEEALLVLLNMTYGHAWCNEGYVSTAGDFRVTMSCVDGQWISSDSSGPVPPVCVPVLSASHRSSCPETLEVKNGNVMVNNATDAEVICNDGFSIASLGTQRARLQCVEEHWHLNLSILWECLPTAFDLECTALHISNGLIHMQNSTYGYVECENGFTSTSGMAETQVRCLQKKWNFDLVVEGQAMECPPDEHCTGKPFPELNNGDVINLSGVEGWCHQGFSFRSGDSSSLFACVDGKWRLPISQKEGCLPYCHESCLNGGTCIAPDTCVCPPSFTGNTCMESVYPSVGESDIPEETITEVEENTLSPGKIDGGDETSYTRPEITTENLLQTAAVLTQEVLAEVYGNLIASPSLTEVQEGDSSTAENGRINSRSRGSDSHSSRARQLDDINMGFHSAEYSVEYGPFGAGIPDSLASPEPEPNFENGSTRMESSIVEGLSESDYSDTFDSYNANNPDISSAPEPQSSAIEGSVLNISPTAINTPMDQSSGMEGSVLNISPMTITTPMYQSSGMEGSELNISPTPINTPMDQSSGMEGSILNIYPVTINTPMHQSSEMEGSVLNISPVPIINTPMYGLSGMEGSVVHPSPDDNIELVHGQPTIHDIPHPMVSPHQRAAIRVEATGPEVSFSGGSPRSDIFVGHGGADSKNANLVQSPALQPHRMEQSRSDDSRLDAIPVGYFEGTTVDTFVQPTTESIPCTGLYPLFPNANTISVDGVVKVKCNPGKSFPSGFKEVEFGCERGQWILPKKYVGNLAECIDEVTCKRPCENGGHCLPDGTCACSHGHSGDHCEVSQCGPLPIVVYNAALTLSTSTPVATCHAGYTFSGGEESLEFKCINGEWLIPERYKGIKEVTCMAMCYPPCTHGGKCIEPDLCRCPEKFTGDSCDVLKCYSAPPYVNNAIIEYDPVISRARCLDGYQLSSGNTSLNIECVDGEWIPAFCEEEINPKLECQPVCKVECKNGGTCVAPNSCACPVPYDGPICTEIRDNHCNISPPVVKKAYMNYTVTLGKADCLMGYALSTGETSIRFICSYGQWEFHEAALKIPECQPVCAGGCQNGGVCVDANTCTCIKPYTGQLCQDVATDICPTPPAPIPNSIMHMSPRGLLVGCRAGYSLPSGNTQTELWCQNNRWVPATYNDMHGLPVMIEDATKPLACFPTCSPPCQNQGKCVDINTCQCQEPYTGFYCQDLISEYCWKEPPPFDNAYIKYNSSRATVTCKQGFIFETQANELTLACRHGEWEMPKVTNGSACAPSCVPPCDNGGICTAPNTCSCRNGFYGNLCQVERCTTVPSAILDSYVTSDTDGGAVLSCFVGYIMNTGTFEILMECIHGSWVTVETTPRTVEQLECRPFCAQLCLNNGSCVAPNLCNCTTQYAGQYCQYERCTDMPIIDSNAVINLSKDLTRAEISCQRNYRLSTGHAQLDFLCRTGRWIGLEAFYISDNITCSPMCPRGCANGGDCVAPNTCQCPMGFTGSVCNKRYSKVVTGQDCVFPYLYNNTWYPGCTGVDSDRPWCAIEVTVHGFISSWSVCVADLGPIKVVMTMKREVCSLPFIYNGERHYGCITTKDRLMPWCATKIDGAGVMITWDVCDLDWGVKHTIRAHTGDVCQFPFIHGGKRYNQCVDNGMDRGVYPWCATKTSPEGIPLTTATCLLDWGIDQIEITITKKVCQFPFVWKNQTVYSCLPATSGMQGPWCATTVDENRIMKEWDQCVVESGDGRKVYTPGSGTPPPLFGVLVRDIPTVNGYNCITPFMFGGKIHNGCIKEGHDHPWCATAVDSELNVIAKDTCPNNWDIPSRSHPHNMSENLVIDWRPDDEDMVYTISGHLCILPFRYKGMQYHGCITLESNEPFCATSVDRYEEATATETCPGNWDARFVGPDTRNEPNSHIVITFTGEKCIFPFVYDSVQYNGCINMGSTGLFCATKVDYKNVALDTGHCPDDWSTTKSSSLRIFSTGEGEPIIDVITVLGEKCIFPFVFNGIRYTGCVTMGTRRPFCATKVDKNDVVLDRGSCPDGWDKIRRGSLGDLPTVLTLTGKNCIIPFVYNGHKYYGCITLGLQSPFCATKVNHHGVTLEIDHCPDDWDTVIPGIGGTSLSVLTKSGKKCQIPFVYKSVTYYGCITIGSRGPFCATEVGSDKETVRTETCTDEWDTIFRDSSGNPSTLTTGSGKICVIPFTYEGVTTYGCIMTSRYSRPFCVTEEDEYGHAKNIDFCPDDWEMSLLLKLRVDETESGGTCVFPFKYGDKTHNECTYDKSFRSWCATVVDDELNHKEWGYCSGQGSPEGGKLLYGSSWGSMGPNTDAEYIPGGALVINGYPDQQGYGSLPGGSVFNPLPGKYTMFPSLGESVNTEDGLTCVFPFVWRGNEYDSCIQSEFGDFWCATSVDAKREVVTTDKCLLTLGKGNDYGSVGGGGGGFYRSLRNPVDISVNGHIGNDYGSVGLGGGGIYGSLHKPVDISVNGHIGEQYIPEGQYPPLCRKIRTTSEQECILPFKYEEKWHKECILLTEKGSPMCAVQVDDQDVVTAWDTCPPGWYKEDIHDHSSSESDSAVTSSDLSAVTPSDLPAVTSPDLPLGGTKYGKIRTKKASNKLTKKHQGKNDAKQP